MKLLTIKLSTSIVAALFSTVTFSSSIQANDLVKAEAFNINEFSTLMNLTVTKSVKTMKIKQDFAKNTADEILVNKSNKLDKSNTKITEQVSLIAE